MNQTRNKLQSNMLVTPCFPPGSAHGPRPPIELAEIDENNEPNLQEYMDFINDLKTEQEELQKEIDDITNTQEPFSNAGSFDFL